MQHLVATERLGWPRDRWWHALTAVFGETQSRLRYDIEPDSPTATCHLQPRDDVNALCGFPWECLVLVPGQPPWRELARWLRCDECEDMLASAADARSAADVR
ncbi:hypothetical protein GCM10023170_098550 [Phytohabitans houttuyneae]|uniref:Uncharacterized protein n=1 Tax=Phytohabitans houttuyneae TaxID=1076126 RepID=A0A6V8KHC8_9ACTN|nr:hypothetical protein Phou_060510 [Phytohabitans houttuyneae]